MLEISDQIQAPVLPESPVPEIPRQCPASEIPQPDGAPDEAALTAEIAQLWQIHSDYKTSIKHQSESLRTLRTELGKKLSDMKRILARPGCGGEWSGWLKHRKISRATADRLVIRYERSLHPDTNCLTEAISEPSQEAIQSLFDKVAPRLRKVLRTPTSVYRFIELLTSSFEGVDRRLTEEGILILKPAQQVAVVDSVPAESPVEPAPSIADVVVEADPESMGTSMAL
jgi:hypothetical protein